MPSLTRRTALSAMPLVCGLCGVQVSFLNPNSIIALLNSAELSVYTNPGLVLPKYCWKMTFVSLVFLVLAP